MATRDVGTGTRTSSTPDYGRVAAMAGLATAVLVLISIIITFSSGAPPALDDPEQKVIDYYQNNQGLSEIGAIVGFLILGTAATFYIGLYTWLRDSTRGDASDARNTDANNAWPRLALASFIAAGSIVAVQGASALAIALGAQDEFDGSPGIAGALFNLYNALGAAFAIPFAVFFVATGVAIDRARSRGRDNSRGELPSWLTPALYLGGVSSFIAFFAPFAEIDALAYFGLIAYIVFGLLGAVCGNALRAGTRTSATR